MGSFLSPYGDYDRYQFQDGTYMPAVFSHYQQSTLVSVANTITETTIFGSGIGSRIFRAGFLNVEGVKAK